MIDLIKIFAVSVFLVFCLSLLYNAVKLQWRRNMERKSKAESDGRIQYREAVHIHDMRQVTEFIKQCRFCREFEIAPDAPTGLYDFLVENRRIKGAVLCPSCEREIPRKLDLPQSPFTVNEVKCPYCQFDLKNWNFSDEENN